MTLFVAFFNHIGNIVVIPHKNHPIIYGTEHITHLSSPENTTKTYDYFSGSLSIPLSPLRYCQAKGFSCTNFQASLAPASATKEKLIIK